MAETAAPWRPRQFLWDARANFATLHRAEVGLDEATLARLRGFFWFDLCAEWDSRHLHDRLMASAGSFSPEFLAFETAWFEDEINHAEGFLRLFAVLYGEDEGDLRRSLDAREPDFSAVAAFLEDEFDLAVLFAYDELATMRAYRIDMDLYRRFELPSASRWIRHLMRDETYHHKNAFDLVLLNHRHRLREVPDLIRAFLAFDEGDNRYCGTFVFDHEWAHVRPDFFARTAEILEAAFLRAALRPRTGTRPRPRPAARRLGKNSLTCMSGPLYSPKSGDGS